jgi:hypothetical protein
MKRIAAPMVGGLASSFLMELLVYPVLYMVWRQYEMRHDFATHPGFTRNARRESYAGALSFR